MKKLDLHDMMPCIPLPQPLWYFDDNENMKTILFRTILFRDVIYNADGEKPFAMCYFRNMMNTMDNTIKTIERLIKNEKQYK